MKIDFSTIFLVIFLVLPGLFSRRSQNSVAPRTLEAQGATEELAEWRFISFWPCFLRFLERWLVSLRSGSQAIISRYWMPRRPIIYQVLSPEIADDGAPSIVFVEAEMKDAVGFYPGQVRQYAVVKDGEPHKLVYLIEAWFKLVRADVYIEIEAEGVMIDLADVATLKVSQVSASSLMADEIDSKTGT